MERLKLVWEFKGPDAKQFALHHEIHLKEFVAKENLQSTETSTEQMEDRYWRANFIILQSDLDMVKNALKPHRGFKV